MTLAVALMIYLAFACLFFSLLIVLNSRKLRLAARILELTQTEEERAGAPETAWQLKSIWSEITSRLADVSVRLTPASRRRKAQERLRAAGLETAEAVRRFRGTRLALRLATLATMLAWLIASPTVSTLDGAVIIIGLVEVGPRIWLVRRMRRQLEGVQDQLPGMLDLLTISVEAGLGFDQALARVARSAKGALGSELRKALAEIGLGKTRKDALGEMADRLRTEDVRTFVTAVLQAERLGMGMAGVLRLQAEDARKRMRQRAQERAMKAPVKILFPLVFFLFPGLFVVILGPAMMHIVAVFAQHG